MDTDGYVYSAKLVLLNWYDMQIKALVYIPYAWVFDTCSRNVKSY